MITYITGSLVEKNPAYLVIETEGGIAYLVHISLNTFAALKEDKRIKIYTHYIVKDDALLLFGFADENERQLFRLLISISGIGGNTARLILSSLNPNELSQAIANENVRTLCSIKGIGNKTAQRIIIELKDKIMKVAPISLDNFSKSNNNNKNEALSGLVSLGFAKHTGEAMLEKIIQTEGNDLSVEDLIKKALKML